MEPAAPAGEQRAARHWTSRESPNPRLVSSARGRVCAKTGNVQETFLFTGVWGLRKSLYLDRGITSK